MPTATPTNSANLLPRGVEYRGADPQARESFNIINTFMQRMRAKEVAGALQPIPTGVTLDLLSNFFASGTNVVMHYSNVTVLSINGSSVVNLGGTNCT